MASTSTRQSGSQKRLLPHYNTMTNTTTLLCCSLSRTYCSILAVIKDIEAHLIWRTASMASYCEDTKLTLTNEIIYIIYLHYIAWTHSFLSWGVLTSRQVPECTVTYAVYGRFHTFISKSSSLFLLPIKGP